MWAIRMDKGEAGIGINMDVHFLSSSLTPPSERGELNSPPTSYYSRLIPLCQVQVEDRRE